MNAVVMYMSGDNRVLEVVFESADSFPSPQEAISVTRVAATSSYRPLLLSNTLNLTATQLEENIYVVHAGVLQDDTLTDFEDKVTSIVFWTDKIDTVTIVDQEYQNLIVDELIALIESGEEFTIEPADFGRISLRKDKTIDKFAANKMQNADGSTSLIFDSDTICAHNLKRDGNSLLEVEQPCMVTFANFANFAQMITDFHMYTATAEFSLEELEELGMSREEMYAAMGV